MPTAHRGVVLGVDDHDVPEGFHDAGGPVDDDRIAGHHLLAIEHAGIANEREPVAVAMVDRPIAKTTCAVFGLDANGTESPPLVACLPDVEAVAPEAKGVGAQEDVAHDLDFVDVLEESPYVTFQIQILTHETNIASEFDDPYAVFTNERSRVIAAWQQTSRARLLGPTRTDRCDDTDQNHQQRSGREPGAARS